MSEFGARRGLESTSRTRHAFGALALVLTFAVPSLAQEPTPPAGSWNALREVGAIFEEIDAPDAKARLRALGPSAMPAAWAYLSGRGRSESVDVDTKRCRAVLKEVLERLPAEEVVPELLGAVDTHTSLGERLVLLDLLAWTDSAEALLALYTVLEAVDPIGLASHRVSERLQSSLAELLDEHPHRFKRIAPLFEDLPQPLFEATLRYSANHPSPEASRLLYSTALRIPGAERLVLENLARRRSLNALWVPQDFLTIARRKLDAKDPLEVRLAVSILGRIGDHPSFEHIGTFLELEECALRRESLRALQRMSGLQREWETERWLAWYRDEERRLQEDTQRAIDVQTMNAGRAMTLLRDLSTHKLFAEHAIEPLGAALNHPDVNVRVLACRGLAEVEHPSTVPYFIQCLDDREEVPRATARGMLQRLAGQDLGPDRRDWEDWWNNLD